MELKIVKEKEPQLKLKKEAEVAVHTKNYLSSVKKGPFVFRKKPDVDVLGNRKKGTEGKEAAAGALSAKRRSTDKKQLSENITKGKSENRQRIPESFSQDTDIPADVSPAQMLQDAGIPINREAKEKYRREQAVKAMTGEQKKAPKRKELAAKGLKKGGTAFLTQMEGGEEVNESLYVMDNVSRPAREVLEKQKYLRAEKELKIKQADGKISSRQFKKEAKLSKKKIAEKTKNQAVRQRKLQYVIDKLTGSKDQDSLLQMTKDIVKMKAEFLMLKAVKFMGVLLAPLFGIILAAAVPVVLVFYVLYASPMAAFMPNPSEENPAVREVLGGYYAQFNAELMETNGGQAGTITYLHEENGNYVSNFMDTLMVYMVRYGTGDMGVDMDEEHKRYLKEIFDEMNSYENTTVTTTIQAGQSLGNVVTSAYCSCSICCGQWAGGPTASGVMPTPNHTLAVDASNPFVPMGTKIVMNGTEYKVEDTGAFDQFGVQFDIYFADHATASAWGHQTFEAFLADGDENEITVTRYGSYVKNLNYEDYIALGILTEEEEELLREVMSEDFRDEIPSFGVGSDVANLALTKVGCRYSQERRYEEGYYDCSSLVQRLYRECGIELPSIASTQGQYIVDHGLEVTEDQLEPGDLIFYSYENNQQFRNISHVAIYIGNGRMVHAANSSRGVVNDPLNPSNIGLYGRPSMSQ